MVNHIKNRVAIKLAFTIILIISFSCKTTYSIEKYSIFYSPEKINQYVEDKHSTSLKTESIQQKLLLTLKKELILITSDSLLFVENKFNALLLKYGESNNRDKGYFLIVLRGNSQIENICVLYQIKKQNKIILSLYNLPHSISKWDDVKPFLLPDNSRMRFKGGGIK